MRRVCAVLFSVGLLAGGCGDAAVTTSSTLPTSQLPTPTQGAVGDSDVAGPTPIVIDSDFGGDDMMALLYLLSESSLSVRAVTITGTGLAHCPEGGVNARAILDHVGFEDVPVACGPGDPLVGSNAFPDDWREGADSLAAQLGLEVPATVDSRAVELLIETIKGSSEPIRLLALGPLTNVALALQQDPEIVENLADIVIMGGAVDVNGTVEPDLRAEWNVWVDPAAANRVLESGVPITLIPLDATNDVPATVFFHEALTEQRATPEAELVFGFFDTNPHNLEGGAYFFWDPLAAVAMVDPDVITSEARQLRAIESADGQHGATVESPQGVEVTIATGADRQRFEEAFLTTLNGGILAVIEIPTPHLTVTYNDGVCSFVGPTTYVADEDTATVVLEIVNTTEGPVAVVFGLHAEVGIDQVMADVATLNEFIEAPAYWEQTGVVPAFGASLTGGSVTGRVKLVPGAHAMICANEENELTVLGDVAIDRG